MKALKLFLLSLVVVSCGHFKDDPTKSVWSEGLWILPLLTGGGAILFWVLFYKSWQSGSKVDKRSATGGKIEYSTQKVPFYKVPYFYFAAGLTIATLVIVWTVNAQR